MFWTILGTSLMLVGIAIAVKAARVLKATDRTEGAVQIGVWAAMSGLALLAMAEA